MTDEPTEPFRQRATRELAEIIGADVPPVFADTERIYALKIGISADILARYPNTDPERLSQWLKAWTAKGTYQAALRYHKHRIDLDGNEAGRISQADRVHAGWRLKQMSKAKDSTGGVRVNETTEVSAP